MLVKNFSSLKSVYVKSVRFRATFFNFITMLFILSISVGLIFQGSYLVITQYNSLDLLNLIFCFIGLPFVFLLCAIIIDDMVLLIFDSMNNPPFLKSRSHLSTVFFNNEKSILTALKFNNYSIILSLELFPILSGFACMLLLNKYDVSTILTGYILGGAIFSIFISIIFTISHAINSFSKKSQDKYYDFLVSLEKHEVSSGFLNSNLNILSLNFQMFGKFSTKEIDIRVKKPKTSLAFFFFLISLFLILIFFIINSSIDISLFIRSSFVSLSIILLSFSIIFLLPNFLGLTFTALVIIFIFINCSLSLVSENKKTMFDVKTFPIFAKTASPISQNHNLSEAEYPVCKIRWQNNLYKSNNKYLTLLDIIPVNSYIYNSDPNRLNDKDWIIKLIKNSFAGTTLNNVEVEYLDDQKTFGRTVVLYFPEHKIRLMAIRGTLRLSEFLYDLNIYSLPQSLKLFNKLTPVIGFLPKDMVRTIVKYINADRLLGVEEKLDKVLLVAKMYKRQSDRNNDEFIISGHSLGGIMAGIISTKLGVSGIALSPAGIGTLIKRYGIQEEAKVFKSLTTVTMQNDIFGKVDNHLGSVNQLACRYDTSKNSNICHYPSSMLCEIYLNCGDKRGRSPLYSCNQKGVEDINKQSFQ